MKIKPIQTANDVAWCVLLLIFRWKSSQRIVKQLTHIKDLKHLTWNPPHPLKGTNGSEKRIKERALIRSINFLYIHVYDSWMYHMYPSKFLFFRILKDYENNLQNSTHIKIDLRPYLEHESPLTKRIHFCGSPLEVVLIVIIKSTLLHWNDLILWIWDCSLIDNWPDWKTENHRNMQAPPYARMLKAPRWRTSNAPARREINRPEPGSTATSVNLSHRPPNERFSPRSLTSHS